MATDTLTLFCLISGESTSKSFKVRIVDKDADVSDLKDDVFKVISNPSGQIKAKDLVLWKATIPVGEERIIELGSLGDKIKLDNPRTGLSKLFPESPDDNTYIVVEKPEASTILKKANPSEGIDNELAQIIEESRQAHVKHTIDPAKVVAAQKKKLGPFYEKPLPYGEREDLMIPAMLGLLRNKQPMSTDNKTLLEIVGEDVGRTTGQSVVAMVGRSGSGKTATVIDLARTHFVIYCVCCYPWSLESPDFKDPNFITLAQDVQQMYANFPKPALNSLNDLIQYDTRLKQLAGERVMLEFLARQLFLQVLFSIDPNLEPLQFFREQANGGAITIRELVKKLRLYDADTIVDMHHQVEKSLTEYLTKRGLGLVVALDEAQVAGNRILPKTFIAPSSIVEGNKILDGKGRIQDIHLRGFLTPLCATLGNMRLTLVVLGTSMSLQDADDVYPAVGKRTNFHRITQFPVFNEEDVQNVLSELVDISDCTIPPVKRQKLTGRARFSVSVVNEMFEYRHIEPHSSKQARLDEVIDLAIARSKLSLQAGVRQLLTDDRTGDVAHLLGRMVLAYKLDGGKTWFSISTQADFVDKAVCSLQLQKDGVNWLMEEPLVVEVVEEELKLLGKDLVFLGHLHQLYEILQNLGLKSSAKGNCLEPLVWRALQRFNNFYLADLPFLKGIELPAWCQGLKLQIDEINTAQGYGYGLSDNTRGDLQFLLERPSNKLLAEKSGTRQDGAWFFSDPQYAGSLGIKFFSNPIPQSLHKANETSTDIRCSFMKADGEETYKSMEGIRRDFVKSGGHKITGILRIHIELPCVKGEQHVTHIKKDPATGTEDVMVYINMSNMDDFFFDGIEEKKTEIIRLRDLIKYVIK
ncbi:hypothetical protein EMPS_09890 [Entomortierella parvispora]|uniref:Crinkler effector protein N-terminal domain-containing protein n=1 Tax=Entomortierella parvispora TaxID=205924 RepID=A0A9P3M0G9_9FUNG|nr:hypothetical protein EMPS_09890 [Entomortierella parvispora]